MPVPYVLVPLLLAIAIASVSANNGFCPDSPSKGKLLEAKVKASSRNLFDELSVSEYYQSVQYMVKKFGYIYIPGWNGTSGRLKAQPFTAPTPTSNYIYISELITVPKAEALAFLSKKTSKPPARYARVVVLRGEEKYRDIMEYKVGPLGGKFSNIQSTPLTTPGQIPYIMSPFEGFQFSWAVGAAIRGVSKLKDLFFEMTGGKYCLGEDPACADTTGNFFPIPAWNWLSNSTNGRINHFIWFFTPGYGLDATFLLPLPLTYKLNWTAVDPADWYTFSFEYCHQYFATEDDLLAAYKSGKLVKCSADDYSKPNFNIDWARVDNLAERPVRPGADVPSSREFSPGGQRFQVYKSPRASGTFFSWLGWEGYVAVAPHTGLKFFDLRFKGERIAYEVSVMEQLAQYSGYGLHGQTLFSDTFYQLGSSMQALRPGVDCPEDAVYSSIVVPDPVGRPVERRQAICFFEHDQAASGWRHFQYEVGATDAKARHFGARSTHFIVRVGAGVGNYDYSYELHFKYSGEIEAKVTMAAYMTTTFFDPVSGQTKENRFFAPRVHKYTSANLHGHLSHFKVDLDIKGLKNSVTKTTIKVGTYEDIGLETPGWAVLPEFPMKYFDVQDLKTEQGYQLKIQEPSTVVIKSTDKKDQWGNNFGYALSLGETSAQLLPDNHPFVLGPIAWSKYHLAFTKHKDAEYISHDMRYAGANVWGSRFNFDTYMTPAESIDGEDVVAWVTLVKEHVPKTEDVPLISNLPMYFKISPYNYYPSMQALDVPTVTNFATCSPNVGKTYNYTFGGAGYSLSCMGPLEGLTTR